MLQVGNGGGKIAHLHPLFGFLFVGCADVDHKTAFGKIVAEVGFGHQNPLESVFKDHIGKGRRHSECRRLRKHECSPFRQCR